MMLECTQLTKNFSDGNNSICVLEAIDFILEKGSTTAIIGPSGSGKSTFLHLLAGLDKPTSGSVKVFGNELKSFSENELCKLRNKTFGFVYQHHHLLKDFSVVENIMMPALIQGINFKAAYHQAINLLGLVGLEKRANFNVTKLSGGEKQRVAILRAIINKPQCVLADEPTGNLCQSTADQVYSSLLKLKEEFGMSIVIVTHDIRLANKMDAIYQLTDGKIEKK